MVKHARRTKKRKRSAVWDVIVVSVVVVALAVGSFIAHKSYSRSFSTRTGSANTNQHTPYVSLTDKFEINFPGDPTVTSEPAAVQHNGLRSSDRIYEYVKDSKTYSLGIIEFVDVDENATMTDKQARDFTKGFLVHAKDGVPKKAIHEGFPMVLGKTAYRVDIDSNKKTNEVYIIGFFVGNKLFMITTDSVGQVDFDNFYMSFKLLTKN